MGLAERKARVKAQMEAVNGIGLVHTRMLSLNEVKQQVLYVKDQKINVWMISCSGISAEDGNVNQGLTTTTERMSIHGFQSVNNETDSEAEFIALVKAIWLQINTDRRPPSLLGGTTVSCEPPQVPTIDFRMFGVNQALCHHAEITMMVQAEDVQ